MRGNTILLKLARHQVTQTGNLFQYDYGQRLILTGVTLPEYYEVHFSNEEHGNSKTKLGDSTGVDIPDEYLLTGESIHVWIYLHDGESDGETEYHGIIGVTKRAKPTDQAPTPVQQSVIDQAIAALNAGVTEVEGIAEAMPGEIQEALAEAKASGEFDGFSPTATVSKSGSVATISITDKNGTTTAQVSDGQDGVNGATPVISIGTVSTLSPGSSATASMDTTDPEHPVLSMGIPEGEPGEVTEAELNAVAESKADIIHDTASGAIASFPDGANGMPVKTLTVGIEPVQDLHGQSNPYPAGGGKNLIPPLSPIPSSGTVIREFDTEQTFNGLTISFKFSGSFENAGASFIEGIDADGNSTYVVAMSYTRKSDNTAPSANTTYTNELLKYSTSSTHKIKKLKFYAYPSFTNPVFSELQLEAGSTKTDYAPYSNICPISGWTGANVTRTGKNLYSDKFSDYTKPVDYYVCPIKLNTGTKYSISATLTGTAVSGCTVGLAKHGNRYTEFGAFETIVSNTGDISSYIPKTFTVTSDWDDPKLIVYCSGETQFNQFFQNYNVQLEIGSSPTAFEKYKGNVYPISWQTEAGTVYGGTLTVNKDGTGTLVVDMAKITLDGSEASGYQTYNSYNGFIIIPTQLDENYKAMKSGSYLDGKCNLLPTISSRSSFGCCFGISNSNMIYLTQCQSIFGSTVESLKTYLSTNNMELYYPLATPVTYNLTDLEVIETLKGINNVWADTGNTSINYPADTKLYIDKKFTELQALILEQ